MKPLVLLLIFGVGLVVGSTSELSKGNNEFGFKLLEDLEKKSEGKNVFISPFGVSTVLAMVSVGAEGNTRSQLENALGFTGTNLTNRSTLLKTYQTLYTIPPPPEPEVITDENGQNYTLPSPPSYGLTEAMRFGILNLANGFAFNLQNPLPETFTSAIQTKFLSQILPLEKDRINAWVSNQTKGKIPILVDNVSPNSVAILLNAIYFKATWKDKFYRFSPNRFEMSLSRSKEMQFMEQNEFFQYAKFDDGALIELPYSGCSLDMYIFLPEVQITDPKSGSFFNQPLTSIFANKSLSSRLEALQKYDVDLKMPKFKIEASYDLVSSLKNLGIVDAFESNVANFSSLGSQPFYVSQVKQKTFIDVHENGTEAAAATFAEVSLASLQVGLPKVSFVLNRPFLFFIRESKEQLVLFQGVVFEP